jgi:hypothetical protein
LLLPYSPELNPVEQLWQQIKQRFLSNTTFQNYDDIIERSCQAWNEILSENVKMSVGLHGKQAQESTVLIDTTVQERNITYPTEMLRTSIKWLGAVYFGIELIAPKLYVLRDLCINMH